MSDGTQDRTIEDYNAYRDPANGHVEYVLPNSEAESYLVKDLGWNLVEGDGEVSAKAPSVNVTDAAAKLAEAEGVDLSEVDPTGADGGITKDDVEKAIADRKASGPRFYDEQTSREAELLGVKLEDVSDQADEDGDVMEDNVREAFFGRVTKRADLDKAAEKIGVAEPKKLDNIDAVKAAITDRLDTIEAESGGSDD